MTEVLHRNMNGRSKARSHHHASGEAEVRRGTGFVGTAELPSDDEEAAQQHKVQGRLQARTQPSGQERFVEDDEPEGHRVAFDPGTQDICCLRLLRPTDCPAHRVFLQKC